MLADYLDRTGPRVEEDRSRKKYLQALLLLATAREPIDRFFDKVMVMVEDEQVRANRLALLRTVLRNSPPSQIFLRSLPKARPEFGSPSGPVFLD